jgi:hypothetical protein
MKNHSGIEELLAVYRDLDDVTRREVDQHVQDCTACADRLSAYQAADWELAQLIDPRPNTSLREEFYATIGIRERQGNKWAQLSQLAGRAIEMAVLSLLIVGLAFTLRDRLQSSVNTAPLPSSDSSRTSTTPQIQTSTTDGATEIEETIEFETLRNGHATDQIVPDNSSVESSAASVEYVRSLSFQGPSDPQPALIDEDEGRVYVVQVDDTLWKLAEKYLWDGRRYGEIIEATHAKRAEDPSFALIEDPDRIEPGSKLWIPAVESLPVQEPAPSPVASESLSPMTTGPGGHIAFSFWNDSPARCTYEINVIDVAACLTSPGACQATRRIFSLNNVSEPALSPGGDRLAFRGWGEPPSENSPYLNCAPPVKIRYLANTTLNGTELQGTGGFWEDAHPDWSPDGQQFLFDSTRHEDRISRIFLINTDGSNERDLRIAGQHPAWAPDGQRFVYRGCDLTGNRCGLWLAYAAPVQSWDTGANIIGPVIEDEQAAHPDWSPVSAQIVYQSSKSGSWDLYIVDADVPTSPTALRQLTHDPGIEGLPSWSPDGQWIAYLSDAGGNWGIWIIRADGSEQHLLFPFDGGSFTPRAVEPYGQRDWIDEQISWSQ